MLEEETNRKIKRGLSVSQGNESIVLEARSKILDKIEETTQSHGPYFKEDANFTFLLPNLFKYPCKFRAHLEKDLIEQSTLLHLEKTNRLNWWCDNDCMQRLWPLSTTGDGNCLLHAASLAMWGFHDRHLTLRHALHHRLIRDNFGFFRRWILQSIRDQKSQGFVLSQEEMEKEWHEICSLSLPAPRGSNASDNPSAVNRSISDGSASRGISSSKSERYLTCCAPDESKPEMPKKIKEKSNSLGSNASSQSGSLKPVSTSSRNSNYDFLEQIHVFVLAQVMRRPIIILSDTYVRDVDGNPIQPLSFGGLYLPLMEKPEHCEKCPILLAYSNSHFSALVPMDYRDSHDAECILRKKQPLAIPLIDPDTSQLLPIHFATDPGEEWMKTKDLNKVTKNKALNPKILLNAYMDCEEFTYCPDHKRAMPKTTTVQADTSSSDSTSDTHKHSSLTRALGKQIKQKFSQHKSLKSKAPVDPFNNSDKINLDFWEQMKCNGIILGAHLNLQLPPNYNEMIANYLKSAESDFNSFETKSRRTSVELIDKISMNTSVSGGKSSGLSTNEKKQPQSNYFKIS